MKYTRITALAAVGIAATLSLTACDGDGPGSTSSTGSSASSSSSSASASGGSSTSEGGPGSGGANAGNATSGSGAGNGGATGATTGGKATFCKTQDLAIDATNASTGNSGRVNITMVNRGSTTCSATGFAGVDIKDADHTSSPITRGHAQPRITTLKPGDAAIFDLAYTIDNSGNSLTDPTNILVTPPNETHSVSLNWPAGAGKIKGSYTDVEVYPTHTTK